MRFGSITTNIIADGLVYSIDPANRASYPRTGTTVKDTIGNINGTLSTAEMFNVQSIKTFTFDGVDEFLNANRTFSDPSFTISAWFKFAGVLDAIQPIVSTREGNGGGSNGFIIKIEGGGLTWDVYDAGQARVFLSFSDTTSWNHALISYDGSTNNMAAYLNGSLVGTDNHNYDPSSTNLTMGKYRTGTHFFNGDIGPVQVYNRALSATEVMKNFNVLKDRMGYVAPITVTFLVVAGGGGSMGGYVRGVGGGGAGGLRTSFGSTSGGGASAESNITALPGTSYTVTIGAGGAGPANATNAFNLGNSGNSSVFASITSIGGGRGGSGNNGNGSTGGSAGGHGGTSNSIPTSGTTGQGTAGGTNNNSGIGAGGGGASTAGTAGASGGTGGNGLAVSVTGTSVTYAGGGGGGANAGTGGTGGTGGGGNGGTKSTQTAGVDGSINTGGGAGGAVNIPLGFNGGYGPGHSGGSGVVILRYSSDYTITSGAGLTSSTTTSGGDKITIFTAGTDTITFS